ncbi:MAG TPA: class I SAM-dependent methyltransferase [Candidatus Polarisedimenticolaceae bacterium]|nr:class I SAM-dependent methyltransferase [Candidatus Polarisedimenticolaceae bacterium]
MELAAGRFFDAYGASLDAALEAKVRDIEPWLVPGLVVDRGCGTGAFLRYLAARDWKVVGIELSSELTRRHPGMIQANVMDPVFADGFVENIVLSSVLHEVYSYNGYSLAPVERCLATCARELRPGGRVIIRDIWSPEPGPPTHDLEMEPAVWARFQDFRARFPGRLGSDGMNESRRTARMSAMTAVEFLSKKDYGRHWELELKEVYCQVPLSAYGEIAAKLELNVLHSQPVRNDWIVENRWKAGVRGDLPKFTNQLVVLSKP